METDNYLFKTRGRERLLALGVAGMCILLGFLLFLLAPELPSDGSGKFEFFKTKLYLTNVGPGIFFALFGATITVYSIVTQLRKKEIINDDGSEKNSTIQYRYVQKTKNDSQEAINLRGGFLQDFRTFSKMSNKISGNDNIPVNLKIQYETSLNNAKDYIMRSLWDNKIWGDYNEFKKWQNMNYPLPAPDNISKAADFFLGNQ